MLPWLNQIAKARELRLEAKLNRADGAVALLADDDFGLAMQARHALLPLGHFVEFMIRGFFALGVILFAENEHNNVGVLFD